MDKTAIHGDAVPSQSTSQPPFTQPTTPHHPPSNPSSSSLPFPPTSSLQPSSSYPSQPPTFAPKTSNFSHEAAGGPIVGSYSLPAPNSLPLPPVVISDPQTSQPAPATIPPARIGRNNSLGTGRKQQQQQSQSRSNGVNDDMGEKATLASKFKNFTSSIFKPRNQQQQSAADQSATLPPLAGPIPSQKSTQGDQPFIPAHQMQFNITPQQMNSAILIPPKSVLEESNVTSINPPSRGSSSPVPPLMQNGVSSGRSSPLPPPSGNVTSSYSFTPPMSSPASLPPPSTSSSALAANSAASSPSASPVIGAGGLTRTWSGGRMLGSQGKSASASSIPSPVSSLATGAVDKTLPRVSSNEDTDVTSSKTSILGRNLLGRRPSRSKRGHSNDGPTPASSAKPLMTSSGVLPVIITDSSRVMADPSGLGPPSPLNSPGPSPVEPEPNGRGGKSRGLFRSKQTSAEPVIPQQQQQPQGTAAAPPASSMKGWFKKGPKAAAAAPSSPQTFPSAVPYTSPAGNSLQASTPAAAASTITDKTADQIAAAAAVAALLASTHGTVPSSLAASTSASAASPPATLAALLQNPTPGMGAAGPQPDEPEGLVFCTDLHLAAMHSGTLGVPNVVISCVAFLDRCGLATEGLYRIPGSHKRVKDWQEKFEDAAGKSVAVPKEKTILRSGDVPFWMLWSGLETVISPLTVDVERKQEGDSSLDSPAPAPPPKSPDELSHHHQLPNAVASVPEFSPTAIVAASSAKGTHPAYAEVLSILTSPHLDPARRWTTLPPSTAGPDVVFEGEGAATVASVLKRFLIRIKGGLVGRLGFWEALEEEISDTASPHSLTLRIRRTMVERLPTAIHLATLAHLFAHLNRVSLRCADNKMTPKNLAISLFPQGITGAEYLIENYAEVFLGQA